MKKILISFSALFVVGLLHAQATNTENYIQTRTYLEGVTTSSTTARQVQSVQYFDGLGRPKQVVNVKASPLGRDVVTHIEYDGFGRQVKDYLPVPQSQTLNGAIVPTPLSNATQADIYGPEKIYAEKTLENSPLDRILEQKQVGTAWSTKPVKFQYDANIQADYVRKYETTTTWDTAGKMTVSTIQLLQYFLPSSLYKNTITDEDGNKTIEFKNGQGQVVLVRKVVSATENADTYYVYNEYNQLAFVIPPASPATLDDTALNNFCYQYRYDGRNRLVEKKLPGKGWEYMVYDKADRLIMTQDANMKVSGNWLFTKYDKFSRVVYTGIADIGAQFNRGQVQFSADYYISQGQPSSEERNQAGFTNSGMTIYYGNTVYPTTVAKVLSINYYDTYPTGTPAIPTLVLGQNVLPQNAQSSNVSTKSLPVASYVKNIEDDNWTKAYTWYDMRGRVIGTHSVNHLGGYTKTETELDFAGIPQKVNTYHKRLAADTEKTTKEVFTYDHQNRLLTHTHQIGSGSVEYLTQNKYNELSQLESKKVGGISAATPLQTVDYKYNIRGWMTKINDPATLDGKLFGYEIKYTNPVFSGTAPGRFNGNIAEIDWKSSMDGVLRRYDYQYDALNRLGKGTYSEPGSSLIYNNYFNEELTYDLNGNILTLKRLSKPSSGTVAESIDNLVYNYYNGNQSNRLQKITLPTGVTNNPSGYNALGNTIGYDDNGNMTDQLDKGITKITYNYLNLPNSIKKSTETINYTYRADGVKVGKNSSGIATQTDYLDGFQYETTTGTAVLKFIPTSEGYYNFENNKYIYNYTDHLGNVRLSYTRNDTGIEIIEENNYYPFGLKHERYNNLAGNPSYQYKYNGKELQTETGMYDYGARFYMPDLGRWSVVDPLSELQFAYNPYSYAYGNPMRFNDPTGMIGEDPDPKKIYGPKGGYPIEEVVMTYTKPSPLSFMGINNMNAFHASEDRFAAGIRGSKAALATEKFEKNLAFAMGTFGMGGSNLLASAGWAAFDTYMSYQDEDTQGAVANVQLLAMLIQVRHGNLSKVSSVLDALAAEKGIVISNGITKKGILKVDYLFKDVNDAKNFGAKALGSSKTRIYDGSGKWIGWENKAGDQVYWGHGDWGKGVGSSTFPHLNYNINGQKGHLFLENKINNRGQASEFMSYFNLGK
ncbi:DUF6443 domain-containing protein [Chryseobacterium populi]|uniref:RHS repeat-associated core domain protein containing protein n=1 Tax=Chryseobacterium populi TaxID=1144316 RepID=J2SRA4_9FLAO|nr:DUF6443 domain-containing protein [Chryseobacterium populi]EJL68057.1 RHS repeat-associated core domain protein containing protein [Chryseobacterium populi]